MAEHTHAGLDRITEALESPDKSVQFADGRRVESRPVAELKQQKTIIESGLAKAAGQRPPRAFRLSVSKGI